MAHMPIVVLRYGKTCGVAPHLFEHNDMSGRVGKLWESAAVRWISDVVLICAFVNRFLEKRRQGALGQRRPGFHFYRGAFLSHG